MTNLIGCLKAIYTNKKLYNKQISGPWMSSNLFDEEKFSNSYRATI